MAGMYHAASDILEKCRPRAETVLDGAELDAHTYPQRKECIAISLCPICLPRTKAACYRKIQKQAPRLINIS